MVHHSEPAPLEMALSETHWAAALNPFNHVQLIIVPPKKMPFLGAWSSKAKWMNALHSAIFTSVTRAYQLWGRNTRRCAQAVARPNLKVTLGYFFFAVSDFNQPQADWWVVIIYNRHLSTPVDISLVINPLVDWSTTTVRIWPLHLRDHPGC